MLLAAGCGGRQASGPAAAVERYYQAVAQQNTSDLANVVCPDFEEQARTELDSFQGVKIELSDFSCAETGRSGSEAQVSCKGKFVATYGNEKMDFPLEDRIHNVTNESGDWLVCGY